MPNARLVSSLFIAQLHHWSSRTIACTSSKSLPVTIRQNNCIAELELTPETKQKASDSADSLAHNVEPQHWMQCSYYHVHVGPRSDHCLELLSHHAGIRTWWNKKTPTLARSWTNSCKIMQLLYQSGVCPSHLLRN